MEETSNAEYFLARKTAEEYRRKGYEVALDVPLDFLPGFRADLLVRKPDEVRVIEVKSRSSLAADSKIRQLARVIDSKPGWSFELLLVAEPQRLDSPEGARSFDRAHLLRRVEEAEKALTLGMSEAALVLAWSACEAATRVLVTDQEESSPDINAPGYFLDRAVFLGLISRGVSPSDQGKEVQKRNNRNAIVHGFSQRNRSRVQSRQLWR